MNILKKTTFPFFIATLFVSALCTSQDKNNSDIIKMGAELELVAEDYDFTEGPAVDAEGNVYFTDQPNNRIMKWEASDNSVTEFMKPSGRSNGLYLDDEGNLLSAADEKNELWSIDPDKNVTVLADGFEGKKLNGPNDLWIDANGGIYFTDPYYQRKWWKHQEDPQEARRVYYMDAGSDSPRIVSDEDYGQPNGIIGSPDGKTLYVSDNGKKKTYVFDIGENGELSNRKLFADMGSDGMTLDHLGNVYLTGDGVTVFDKAGNQIQHIAVPEKWTANVTFGGPEQDILFITAMDSIYTLAMNVHGVR